MNALDAALNATLDTSATPARSLQRVIPSMAASDGAGVKLLRSLGQRQDMRLDPFLMLDEFGSDNPDDYIAGFPPHPHRGFETVTYMLEGDFEHEDHLGNKGHLRSGGAQWMTAGRGIIHSEMPLRAEGKLHGFQLWINLPAAEKMKPAHYRDIQPEDIPAARLENGGQVRVVAGELASPNLPTLAGPIQGLSTAPLFLDVHLPAGGSFSQQVPEDHTVFVYAYRGALRIGERLLPAHQAGALGAGARVEVHAAEADTRFILLAARPLHEPIVQYGPFVMNTREEIEQALADYRAGVLA